MIPSSLRWDFNSKSCFHYLQILYSTGSGSPLPINMLKSHSSYQQPSVNHVSPQASILPLPFPSVENNLDSLPLPYNFHSLSWLPSPITLLVTKGTKHVQLVKFIRGPLSRLQIEFSVRKTFLKIDLFAKLLYPLHIFYTSNLSSPSTQLPIKNFQWFLVG